MNLVQVRICEALARHFKESKMFFSDKLREHFKDIETEEHPVVSIEHDSHKCGGRVFLNIGSSKATPASNKLWRYKDFVKTGLYSEVEDQLSNYDAECVCFYTGGALLAVSKDNAYRGKGGLFIKENDDSSEGYVIELFENYLSRTAPLFSGE